MPFIYVDLHLKLYLVCQRLVCQKMEFARFLPVKFKDPKFINFHENRHEAFILSKLLFAIIFSIIKVIIELFVV